jgi:hypothetical protein
LGEPSVVSRSVALALGLVAVISLASVAGVLLLLTERDRMIAEKDVQISLKNAEISEQEATIATLSTHVALLQRQLTALQDRYGAKAIPPNVTAIAEAIRVIVQESGGTNRTLYLDPAHPYCEAAVFQGGAHPFPQDLAYPNASIVFYFLEDLADPEKADNYSDLIVRMNPIIDPASGEPQMGLVFFAEGGYAKWVYHHTELLHHYDDDDPTSNYGIRTLAICP